MRQGLFDGRIFTSPGLLLMAVLCSCNRSAEPPGLTGASPVFPSFEDVTSSTGIDFERDNGHDGKSWRVVETVNGGVALLDFDSDGRLDVYFTKGRRPRPPPPAGHRRYRNLGGG